MTPSALRVVATIDLGHLSGQSDHRFALRRLTDQTILGRMVRRLSEAQQVDRIVISGANGPADFLAVSANQVDLLDSRLPHVCQRLAAVADRYQADWILVIPANRPFLDPVLIDSLVAHARRSGDCDYVSFVSREDHVRRVCQLGLTGEMIHADCLRRLRRNIACLEAQSDGSSTIADWLASAPGPYQMRLIPIAPELDRADLRFVVDDERDWDTAMTLCDAIREDVTDWQTLRELVDLNPALRRSMSERNLRRIAESEKFASSAQTD